MKRSRIILFVCLGIGGAIGVFSTMQPPVYLERSIEINAPSTIVEEKVSKLEKNLDSTELKQFKFKFKAAGEKTMLAWGYTPAVDDNDEMLLKLFWIFKKDNMAKEMDSALRNIKRISENAVPQDSVQAK